MRFFIHFLAIGFWVLSAVSVNAQAKYSSTRLKVYETNIRDYLNHEKCSELHNQFAAIQSVIVSGSYENNPAALDNEITRAFAVIARTGKSMPADCIQKARVLLQQLRECKVYGNEPVAIDEPKVPTASAPKENAYYPLYQRPKGKSSTPVYTAPREQNNDAQASTKVPAFRGNPSNLTLEQIEQLIDERNGKLQQQFDNEITNALSSVSLAIQPEDNSKLPIWILMVSILGLLVSIAALIVGLRANRMVNELDVDFNEVYEKVSMGGVSKMDVDGMIRTSKSLLEAEITLLRSRISSLESKLEAQAFSSANFSAAKLAENGNGAKDSSAERHIFYLPAPDGMGIFKGGQISEQFIPTKTMYKVTRIDNTAGILELVDDSTTLKTAGYSFYDTLRPACEAENPYDGGSDKDISQSAEGRVSLTPSGDWRVTEKIRIRYI